MPDPLKQKKNKETTMDITVFVLAGLAVLALIPIILNLVSLSITKSFNLNGQTYSESQTISAYGGNNWQWTLPTDQAVGTPLPQPGAIASISGLGTVTGINVTFGGSGYSQLSPPTVTITGGGGSGATATATVNSSGAVSGISVTNAGYGYTSVPTVSFSGGGSLGGTGATVTFTAAGGLITAVTTSPVAGGTGYPLSSTFLLLVSGGTNGLVTATSNSSGVVTSFGAAPAAAGTGYTGATGSGTSSTATGATATAVTSSQSGGTVVMTNPVSGIAVGQTVDLYWTETNNGVVDYYVYYGADVVAVSGTSVYFGGGVSTGIGTALPPVTTQVTVSVSSTYSVYINGDDLQALVANCVPGNGVATSAVDFVIVFDAGGTAGAFAIHGQPGQLWEWTGGVVNPIGMDDVVRVHVSHSSQSIAQTIQIGFLSN